MAQIIQLAICHKCHRRIDKGQAFTRYKKQAIYHESCFLEYLDEFDLSEFIDMDVLEDEDEPTSNEKDLVLSSY